MDRNQKKQEIEFFTENFSGAEVAFVADYDPFFVFPFICDKKYQRLINTRLTFIKQLTSIRQRQYRNEHWDSLLMREQRS